MTKTVDKLARLTHAARVSDIAFREFCRKDILLGKTERELASALKKRLLQHGAQTLPFPLIVAFGKNAAEIHHKPDATVLKNNTFILVDFGAKIQGYCSDCTRMIIVGNPGPHFHKRYALVLAAFQAAIKAARPGVRGAALDKVARSIIKKGGYGMRFLHTLGHGIGKKVHEKPSIGPKSQEVLEEGMTFTIEPGIYDKRWGGIRIEDTVVMTKIGVRRLTTLPTTLAIIPSKNNHGIMIP